MFSKAKEAMQAQREAERQRVDDLEKAVEKFQSQVNRLRAMAERPGLESLLDEYKRLGGVENYRVADWAPELYMASGYWSANRTYTADRFDKEVLNPLRVQFAKQHQCKVKK